MSKYHFNEIEAKWQQYWAENQTFKAENKSEKPKYYVLDMFPYPSGAGLHVGHPLGYIASDIYARYKRHKGFNVLHPQGYDSFGLPAEQYAIQTGQHPRKTTEENIARYREQLDKIGFSFDWSREVRTSDPQYYKWTQWIFIQLFESWYDKNENKARDIIDLKKIFSSEGNSKINAECDDDIEIFTSEAWKNFSEEKQQQIILQYRLTYLAETEVNWCPQLGTVLANDEIVNGVSERGGYPVVRKKMKQWSMRISAYAQRLLDGLEGLDWPQPLKDSQTNWIGRSKGAVLKFKIQNSKSLNLESETFNGKKFIEVFTTRPDTIYGVSFMTLAPEHELVLKITTEAQKAEIEAYILKSAKRSERERMADVKTISGVFTGAYAIHPLTEKEIPIWIGDYVLAGYGTGAVMAVPCGDQRDYDFAKHFGIEIPNIFKDVDISEEAYSDKENTVITNSDFLNDLPYKTATQKAIEALEAKDAGEGKINYRLRDAVFSRQRYWGEPFPIYYKNGMPQVIDAKHLPLTLPEVEKYLPTEEGEPPLGRADVWAWDTNKNKIVSNDNVRLSAAEVDRHPELVSGSQPDNGVYPLELNTMPGWAGSSWYMFRYMESGNSESDSKRDEVFASKEAMEYWQNVDLYIGGSEHATGHLLYSRFWVKFLYDRNLVPVNEPFKKLINQGMILGESALVPRIVNFILTKNQYPENAIDLDISKLEDQGEEIDKLKNNFLGHNISYEFLEKTYIKQFKKFPLFIKVKEIEPLKNKFLELGFDENTTLQVDTVRADVSFIDSSNNLNTESFANWQPDLNDSKFISNNGKFLVAREIDKMSKRWYNVVNPDDICEQYGADTLRMYEMFLGPLEQAKPWNTAGITGVNSFLKKLWRLYHNNNDETFFVSEEKPDAESLKILHKTIKKVEEDIENFSFNTSVSTFMIAVNELTALRCNAREILQPFIILLSPYAPHISEELWQKLGHSESISTAQFPKFEANYLVESSKEYPISFNGKMRYTLELPLDLSKDEIETAVMANEKTAHYLEGRTPKKVIVVPGKIVNIVG